MFFCEQCRKKRDWPKGLWFRSFGECEICGKKEHCHDVPSKYLPLPPKEKQ